MLRAIPAVGPVMTATLRGCLPELETLDRPEAPALGGAAQPGSRDAPWSTDGADGA